MNEGRQALKPERPVLTDEAASFRQQLGSPWYSSHDEELFVRDYFQARRDGVFVDVGASHYRTRSNTYYLEEQLSWSGLAIDPLGEFADGYRQHRPRTKFLPFFVSDQSDERAELHVGVNSLFSSSNEIFTDRFTAIDRTITTPTMTLTDILTAERIGRIDFLSVDVELHEPEVLAGFDIDQFPPALVCIEAHPPVRQQILDFFHAHDYVVVAKYLRADPQNLWFQPAASGS